MKSLIKSFLLAALLLSTGVAWAQEPVIEKETIAIKIQKKDADGTTLQIDTLIKNATGFSLEEFLKAKGINHLPALGHPEVLMDEEKVIILKKDSGEVMDLTLDLEHLPNAHHMEHVEEIELILDTDDSMQVKVLELERAPGKKAMFIYRHETDTLITEEIDQEAHENIVKFKDKSGINIMVMRVQIKGLDDDDQKVLDSFGPTRKGKVKNLDIQDLNFFPNPNQGQFKLDFNLPGQGDTEVKIFDLNGKEVYQEHLEDFTGQYSKDIDISTKGEGIYFLQVKQGKRLLTKKLVVQ